MPEPMGNGADNFPFYSTVSFNLHHQLAKILIMFVGIPLLYMLLNNANDLSYQKL